MSVFTVFPWSSIVSKLAHHCTRIQQNKKKVTRTTKHDHHTHKKGHPRRLARAHSGRIRCRGMDGAEDVPKHVSPVPRLHTRTLRDAHFCTYASTHARTHARNDSAPGAPISLLTLRPNTTRVCAYVVATSFFLSLSLLCAPPERPLMSHRAVSGSG